MDTIRDILYTRKTATSMDSFTTVKHEHLEQYTVNVHPIDSDYIVR